LRVQLFSRAAGEIAAARQRGPEIGRFLERESVGPGTRAPHGKLQPRRSVGSAGCFVAGLPSYRKLHREERPPTWRWNDGVLVTPFRAGKPVGGGATALNYHVDKSHSAVPSSRGVLNDDAVGGQDWAIGKVQQSDEHRYDWRSTRSMAILSVFTHLTYG
jgi:hypothetical protein